LLGVSPFSQKKTAGEYSGEFYFLTQSELLKSLQSVKDLPQEKIFFVFPLVLNKEEEWIISEKVFFILPSKERKEISHFTYKEMIDFSKTTFHSLKSQTLSLTKTEDSDFIMTLNTALSYIPKKSHFLFLLQGSNRQKIIKNLDKALLNKEGRLYISSDNERLLDELYQHSFLIDFKILHSYKSLIRLEMMSLFSQSFYKNFKGDGVIVPDLFTGVSFETLVFLKQQGKLIFFEKDPPYSKEDQKSLKKASAVISSSFQESLRICL